MSFIEAFILGIGLSMDSFSVSLACGGVMGRFNLLESLKIAFILAIFQGGLTAVGWLLGIKFSTVIESFDHWIAFGLLLYLGGKMIFDSLKKSEDNEGEEVKSLSLKTIVTLGLATSIDALAIGISIAFLNIMIVMPAIVITAITFIFCMLALYLGTKAHRIPYINVGFLGGVILIAIGLKILLEHLFF